MAQKSRAGTIVILALLGAARLAEGAISLHGGTHTLLPNAAGQSVAITARSSDPANDPLVTGLNLQAVLGDGLGAQPEPVFSGVPGSLQAVDFTGGIWDGLPFTPSGEAPINDFPQFATPSVLFDSTGDEVAADGLVATLLVDTTGFTSGTFNLTLGGVVDPLGPSSFVLAGGADLEDLIIVNGSITIMPSAMVTGDYNENGVVDAADYTNWRNTIGASVIPFSAADGDGSGVVAGPDYDVWKTNYGATAGRGASIPEPGGVTIVLTVMFIAVVSRPAPMCVSCRYGARV